MQFLGARQPPQAVQGSRHLAASLLLFVPLVFAGNEIGAILRYADVGSAVLFVPYAVLTAALVVSRPRDWVWYILIDSIAHFVAHWPQWPMSWVLLATVANVARALAAAVVVGRLCDGIPRFVGIRTLGCFVVGAVIVAPSIGASIGAANVVLHGGSDHYWRPWLAWFTSNALTAFTMLPACIALFSYTAGSNRVGVERRRLAEAALMMAALGATAFILLGGFERLNPGVTLFTALPILFWAALRFGAAGASGALTVITFAAIWSIDRGETSAAGPSDDQLLALQCFVFFTAAPVLCLAAIAAAREAVVQLHRALLASLHDHVALLDARGVMFEANASWLRFADSSAAPLHRARTGDDYLAACWSSAERGDVMGTALFDGVTKVLSGAQQHVEVEYDDPEPGRHETYAIRIESLERPDGGAVVTRANVTARRQAQLEIERHRRELSHLARVNVLGQLSGALAHDLNQPLTAILSNAQAAHKWLLRDPPNTEYAAEILQDIIDDDRRAAAMIHRLRSLLKRGDLRVERIDVADLMSEVLDLSRSELQARNIEPTTSINPAAPALMGDKVQLQQVLLNLILNACDAMNDVEEPRRRLELSVASDDLRTVRLSVRDWGVGLPTDLIERLFEPFVTTKTDGLGLGLSISRTIIAAHGGRLWAENNPGGGATIHCVLPVAEQPEVATAEPTSSLPDAVRH
jgi:signal transduction histidine kinase